MTDSRESKYFSTYQDYNKTLRAWFVAFGAGGPALLAVEPDLRDVLVEKNVLMTVVVYFLAGCACQVFIAFVNKILAWGNYFGEKNSEFKKTYRYKIAQEMGGWFIWDIAPVSYTHLTLPTKA